MVSMSYDYTRLTRGNCGHICVVWPQRQVGTGRVEVVCHTCTRLRWPDREEVAALPEEDLRVWVCFDEDVEVRREARKRVPKKQAVKKVRKLSVWEQLLAE